MEGRKEESGREAGEKTSESRENFTNLQLDCPRPKNRKQASADVGSFRERKPAP